MGNVSRQLTQLGTTAQKWAKGRGEEIEREKADQKEARKASRTKDRTHGAAASSPTIAYGLGDSIFE